MLVDLTQQAFFEIIYTSRCDFVMKIVRLYRSNLHYGIFLLAQNAIEFNLRSHCGMFFLHTQP